MKLNRRQFVKGAATFALAGAATSCASRAPRQGGKLPDWREGYLDIHHIATGRGETVFMIMPDGTTMLIDCGDINGARSDDVLAEKLPNGERTPAAWVAQYIRDVTKPLNCLNPVIDHALMTHFHSDHIGRHYDGAPLKHGYALAGVTELAELLEIRHLVDRGYPNYDFPTRAATLKSNQTFMEHYMKFVTFQRDKRRTRCEGFEVGSRGQFALKKGATRYPEFHIQNLYANGRLWTGNALESCSLYAADDKLDENCHSCALTLSYGGFKYFSGGDIAGFPDKRDVESHVAPLVGKVDAMILNHHGYSDSCNAKFLSTLRPQAMVVSAWCPSHPHPETLPRMLDTAIYPGERQVYNTTLMDDGKRGPKLALGANARKILTGHVVVRVYPGGAQYQVFTLENRDMTYRITHLSEMIATTGNQV